MVEVRKENKSDALRLPGVQKGGVLLAIKRVLTIIIGFHRTLEIKLQLTNSHAT